MSPYDINSVLANLPGRKPFYVAQNGFRRWVLVVSPQRQVVAQHRVDDKMLLIAGGFAKTPEVFSVDFVRELEIYALTPTALLNAWREAEVFTWQTSSTQPNFVTVARWPNSMAQNGRQ